MRYFLLFSYTKERREEKVSDWWDHTNSTRLYFCARTVSLLYSQFFKCKFQNLLPAILFQKNEEWCWFGATAQALERLYIKNSALELSHQPRAVWCRPVSSALRSASSLLRNTPSEIARSIEKNLEGHILGCFLQFKWISRRRHQSHHTDKYCS